MLKIFIRAVTGVDIACHLNKEQELCKIIFKCYLNIEELDKLEQLIEYHFNIVVEPNIYFILANHIIDLQMVFMLQVGTLRSRAMVL